MAQVNVNIEDIKKMASLLNQNQPNISKQSCVVKQCGAPKQLKTVSLPPMAMDENKVQQIVQTIKQAVQSSSEDMEQIVPMTGGNVVTAEGSQIGSQIGGDDQSILDLANLKGAKPEMFEMMGYSLPKYTVYLIIVLMVVGIIIWYLNSDGRKNKKKIIEKHEDEEEQESK